MRRVSASHTHLDLPSLTYEERGVVLRRVVRTLADADSLLEREEVDRAVVFALDTHSANTCSGQAEGCTIEFSYT